MRRERTLAAGAGTVLLLAPVLAGCGYTAGPTATESREIGQVHTVELRTSGNLAIVHGDEPRLSIEAGEQVIDRLTAVVEDGVLVLDAEPGWQAGRIVYLLEIDELRSVTVAGSGDVVATDVAAEDLVVRIDGSGDVVVEPLDAGTVEVRVAGSGNVRLAGSADSLSVEVDGSGDVEAFGLATSGADVTVSGSGDVQVAVAKRLDVLIQGSGSVTFDGDPEVSSDVEGSGDVSRR